MIPPNDKSSSQRKTAIGGAPKIKAVVLGLFVNGTALMRRLSMLGYEVHGVTHSPAEEGLRSRHGVKHDCPDPLTRFDDWLAFVAELGARIGGRPSLLPTQDRFVLAMDKGAEALAPFYRFVNFGSGLRTQLTAKSSMFTLAARHGFPMTRTTVINGRRELLDFCREATWPVLIKPDYSHHWRRPEVEAVFGYRKVLTAPDPEALAEAFETVRQYSPDAIAQEVIPGPDQNLLGWIGYVGADGRVRGRTLHRRLRIHPVHFGQSTLAQLVDMPEVEAECERWLATLGYRGVAGIELKIDERDGVAKLVEINPRSVGNDAIGVPVGVDFARESVEGLLGREMEPHRPVHFAQKWLDFTADLRAFRQYRAEGSLSVLDWLRSLAPPITISDFPWRDDFPYAWSNARALIGDVARGMVRRGRKGARR